MKSLAVLLLAATTALPAHADTALCAGNPALAALGGTWVQPAFLEQLRRTRSFSAAQAAIDDQHVAVYIEDGGVYFNLAWHEGGEGKDCLRVHGDRIDVGENPGDGRPPRWYGPYVRLGAKGRADEDDSVWLKPFFSGCWRSDRAETWCLSPTGFTIDGRRIEARLQKDPVQRPAYGTAFLTALGAHPFTVFMPVADGWDVFQDDWREGNPPIDPQRDKPWRRLRPL
jgi:hypothetical protein